MRDDELYLLARHVAADCGRRPEDTESGERHAFVAALGFNPRQELSCAEALYLRLHRAAERLKAEADGAAA